MTEKLELILAKPLSDEEHEQFIVKPESSSTTHQRRRTESETSRTGFHIFCDLFDLFYYEYTLSVLSTTTI